MQIKTLSLDVKIIIPDFIMDERGWLSIPFSRKDYKKESIEFDLKQINQAYSRKKRHN